MEQFESTKNLAELLPDLPGMLVVFWLTVINFVHTGKILFGRSQVHQVAEKRRGKIEEFCQVVYCSVLSVFD